jgi:hypothetical protein
VHVAMAAVPSMGRVIEADANVVTAETPTQAAQTPILNHMGLTQHLTP